MRGHVDDQAAASCSMTKNFWWDVEAHPVGPPAARALCRQELVVEGYDLLGFDPSFGTG